jgi:S1-C subfamily serine protease
MRIASARDLSRTIARQAQGKALRITVTRDGKPVTLDVTLAALEQPADQAKTAPAAGDETAPGSLGLHS